MLIVSHIRLTAKLLFRPHGALKYTLRVQRTALCTGILRPSLSLTVRSDQSAFSNQLQLVSVFDYVQLDEIADAHARVVSSDDNSEVGSDSNDELSRRLFAKAFRAPADRFSFIFIIGHQIRHVSKSCCKGEVSSRRHSRHENARRLDVNLRRA